MTDKELGTKALRSYFENMVRFYPAIFKDYSFEKFLATIATKVKGGRTLADGLGGGIRETGLSSSQVSEGMKKLAQNSRGRVPATFTDFFNALTKQATQVNYLDAAAFVLVESTKDVVKGAAEVGDSLITTGKILNFILPAILIFLVFFWLNQRTGGEALKFAKGLRR